MSLSGLAWLDGRFDADLPEAQDLHVATLGWRENKAPLDEGLSADVALLLARLVLAAGEAIFIDHHLGVGDGERVWRRNAGGLLYSLPGPRTSKFGLRGRALDLMATHDPTILATLAFGSHAWPLQQQVILIAENHRAAEQLDAQSLTGWLGARGRPDWRATFQKGVQAVLCAGHDGSMAGLYAPEPDRLTALRAASEAICADTGLVFRQAATPEAFAQLIGFGPPT